MTTPVDILKAARELISNPDHWGKGAYKRDYMLEDRIGCLNQTTCYCAVGALFEADRLGQVKDPDVRWFAEGALRASVKMMGVDWVEDWNDDPERTHADVLDLYDRTIARLEATG